MKPPDSAQTSPIRTHTNTRLEALVDRSSLEEIVASFACHFGIPVRLLSTDGTQLAGTTNRQGICLCVTEFDDERTAGSSTRVGSADAVYDCCTGAQYCIASIVLDNGSVGRIVLGPYLPSEQIDVPNRLRSTAADSPTELLDQSLSGTPSFHDESVLSIARCLRSVLETIRASQKLTANMQDKCRELQDGNSRLHAALNRRAELDQLQSSVLAAVGHEIRTPLTSIIGYTDLLEQGIAGELSTNQLDFLKIIKEQGEQLLALLTSLLDMSKLENGGQPIIRTDVDVCKSLSDVVSWLMPNARKARVTLSVNAPSQALPLIPCDAAVLRQVVLNLATNAIKFTPPGGSVTLTARICQKGMDHDIADDIADDIERADLSADHSVLEIRVADTGIGVAESEREKIFDPFYQIESPTRATHNGVGLGLPIVKRLVQAHNGSVFAQPNHPKGCVFVVRIPVTKLPSYADAYHVTAHDE